MNKEQELKYLYGEHVKNNTLKAIKKAKDKRPKDNSMESTKRSLTKTLSWEFVHLVIIAGVIFVITGEWEYATLGALVYIAWEALAYFIHERIWAKFVKIK
jgi:uncharacterized membrane protein